MKLYVVSYEDKLQELKGSNNDGQNFIQQKV